MAGFLSDLGPRARWRPVPRLTIVLAAAGCLLAVNGALIVGGDGLAGSGDGGNGSKVPGALLAAGVVLIGFALLSRFPVGPLGTAGAVAATLGVPPLLFFLTFSQSDLPPYSSDAILFASTGAWIVSYLVGPGRGRAVFLGAAAIGVWLSVVQLSESAFDFPFFAFNILGFQEAEFDGGFASAEPDATNIGGLSLAFAAAYLAVGRAWDRAGYAGAATPLTAAALVAIPVGLVALAGDLEATGTGLLTAAVGVALASLGAASARRATAWLGGLAVAIGVLVVVGDAIDEATPGGLTLMVAGAALVAAAEMIRRGTDEPDEVVLQTAPDQRLDA